MKHMIPDAALDKHVALLGMTGAGKTSVIKAAIVEPELDADGRVLIITPKDDWWGLRLSKTGKSKGYDIPIFGGLHGDYPLQVKDAALLAEAYGTMKGSAIFVTSRLSVEDRAAWFTHFAETLLTKNRGAARVVIDEAHVFMPKQGASARGGGIPKALHAGNELVSQGRSMGLRIVLASQRSAKLHNDALTQCSCLIAMMLMAPHDRDAVKDWIEDQADPEVGKTIVASLANLNPGQAWVWAPRAKFLEKVQFPRPHTFDSSAGPGQDDGEAPELPAVNLDALKGKLVTVEAQRKANDPKAMRAEIAALKLEIQKRSVAKTDDNRPDPDAIKKAEERGFEQAKKKLAAAAERESLSRTLTAIQGVREIITQSSVDQLLPRIDRAIAEWKKQKPNFRSPADIQTQRDLAFTPSPGSPASQPGIRAPTRPAVARPPIAKPSTVASGDGSLPAGERSVLTAIAQYPDGVERDQITVLTGYKRSTRDAYIHRLGTKGFIDVASSTIRATAEGVDALGADFEPLPTGTALQEYWLARLPEGERRILSLLIEAHPEAVERDQLTESTGYKRSTRDAYLSRLGSRRLVTGERGPVRASALLFDLAYAA